MVGYVMVPTSPHVKGWWGFSFFGFGSTTIICLPKTQERSMEVTKHRRIASDEACIVQLQNW
jgi:hypothetical protein